MSGTPMNNATTTPEAAAGVPVPSTRLLAGLYSSAYDEWPTPWGFFEQLKGEFGPFDLDVCATPQNTKCLHYFTREQDGLAQPWAPARCWMNPPYGRTIGAWMAKAWQEAQRGALVVCLVPARTDTAWWHDYAAKGKVRFLRGRLRFEGGTSNAPFPSAVVVFHPANAPHQARAVASRPECGCSTIGGKP